MNKIKKMYALWAIIVIGLFAFLTAFGFLYKKKTVVYKELEEKLETAEKRYIDAKFLYPDQNESLKTNATILIENGYLDALEINGEKCDGYAVIIKKDIAFEYKAYIKCPNYKTKGYKE